MEVSVERYQRKKYVNQENSPVLYYIRQKAGTAKVVDIDALVYCLTIYLYMFCRKHR